MDLCQWANDADNTAPVEYEPTSNQLHARYANGVKLVMRDDGWLPLGSCPVRFEGDTGWVETGDDGEIVSSSPALLAGMGAKISGYPADFHVRNFLDCVKSRGQTRANADAACHAHIACHAANIALFLHRKLQFDPQKNEFIGDEEANRFRSEALARTLENLKRARQHHLQHPFSMKAHIKSPKSEGRRSKSETQACTEHAEKGSLAPPIYDFQSAVSRISNPQMRPGRCGLPTGSRRYSRLETCATQPREPATALRP